MSDFISIETLQPASRQFAPERVASGRNGAAERMPANDRKSPLSGRAAEKQGPPDAARRYGKDEDSTNGSFKKILSESNSAQTTSINNTSETTPSDNNDVSPASLDEGTIKEDAAPASDMTGTIILEEVVTGRGESTGTTEALNGKQAEGQNPSETARQQRLQVNDQALRNEVFGNNPGSPETEPTELALSQQEAGKAEDKPVDTLRQEGLLGQSAKESLPALNRGAGEPPRDKAAQQDGRQPFSEGQWGNKTQGEWFYKLSESMPEEGVDAGRNPLSFQAQSSSKTAPVSGQTLSVSPENIVQEGTESSVPVSGSDERAATADSRPEPMARTPRPHFFAREDASPARFQFNTTRALNAFKHQIDLKIHDADFGKMHWRVNMEGGKIAADVVVETSRVQELIQNNQESLQSRINNLGMGMKNLDVAVNHGSQQNLPGSHGRNTDAGQRNIRSEVNAIAPEKADMPVRTPLRRHHNEGLSLYI